MAENPYTTPSKVAQESAGLPEMGPVPEKAPPHRPHSHRNTYKAQMTRANIILAVLFAGGAATVYGLSVRKGPAEASAEQKLAESSVDSALLRLQGGAGRGTDALSARKITRDLLSNFSDRIVKNQIPLDKLEKNPFVFIPPEVRGVQPIIVRTGSKPKVEETPEEITQKQAMERLSRLRLQSVMMGSSGSAAVISNNLLTEGQQTEGFTVKKISSKSVVLTWRGQEFILKMSPSGG
jgi:hypothetical protein